MSQTQLIRNNEIVALIVEKMNTKSQGLCETTSTERFENSTCQCTTYPGNLGPCAMHEIGSNGRCVYCDHKLNCNPQKVWILVRITTTSVIVIYPDGKETVLVL